MTLQYSVCDVVLSYNTRNCWVQKVLPILIWSNEGVNQLVSLSNFALLEKLKNIVKKIPIYRPPFLPVFFSTFFFLHCLQKREENFEKVECKVLLLDQIVYISENNMENEQVFHLS